VAAILQAAGYKVGLFPVERVALISLVSAMPRLRARDCRFSQRIGTGMGSGREQ